VIVAEVASIYSGDPKTSKTSDGKKLPRYNPNFRDFNGEITEQVTAQVRISLRDLTLDFAHKAKSKVFDF